MDYTMKTVAEAADIAYETVRYYCKIGLVPNVRRSANGYRVFDERDVAWLQGLHCLRQCGMSIEQMRRYMELCLVGEGSIPEREDMLTAQRKVMEDNIAQLTAMLQFIDAKMAFYAGVKSGEIEYYSNILPPAQEHEDRGVLAAA